jgi:hypothetical protein
MLGAEEVLGRNAVRITVRLTEALDPARVADAWARQVAARPTLRSRLKEEDSRSHKYIWVLYREEDLEEQLAIEALDIVTPVDEETLDRHARREDALPYRLRLLDEHTLVALVDPKLTNATGGASWVEDWLGFYGAKPGETPGLAPALQTMRRVVRQRNIVEHLRRPFLTSRWFVMEFCRYLMPARTVVDLANGRSYVATPDPAAPPSRTLTWRHVFDEEQSRQLMRSRAGRRRTLTVQLLVAAASLLLEVSPARRRARIALDADLASWLPESRRGSPGNTSCCVEVPMARGKPLVTQALRVYRNLVRGTHCRMRSRRLRLIRNEARFVRYSAKRARKGRLQNAPITDASLQVCNMGRHAELRRLERDAEWISVATPAPTVSLTTVQVAHTLTLEVCFPGDRYDNERLLAFAKRLPAMMLSGSTE